MKIIGIDRIVKKNKDQKQERQKYKRRGHNIRWLINTKSNRERIGNGKQIKKEKGRKRQGEKGKVSEN